MHTQWSDGSGSIQEMAEAASDPGYGYIAITDHSKGLKIAGGIDEQQLQQQAAEIESVNQALENDGRPPGVLQSVELNLNPAGGGDMTQESLRRLDLVLGCFHSSLRKKEDQTARYIAALRNPDIQILGHPRGRIYNFRLGLNADWPRVFAVAAELDKAVEIDSYPDRQDLSLDLIKMAKQAGWLPHLYRHRFPRSYAAAIYSIWTGRGQTSRTRSSPNSKFYDLRRTEELGRRGSQCWV